MQGRQDPQTGLLCVSRLVDWQARCSEGRSQSVILQGRGPLNPQSGELWKARLSSEGEAFLHMRLSIGGCFVIEFTLS